MVLIEVLSTQQDSADVALCLRMSKTNISISLYSIPDAKTEYQKW